MGLSDIAPIPDIDDAQAAALAGLLLSPLAKLVGAQRLRRLLTEWVCNDAMWIALDDGQQAVEAAGEDAVREMVENMKRDHS